MKIKINTKSANDTVKFASAELLSYIHLMQQDIDNDSEINIDIGTYNELEIKREIFKNSFDDEILVDIKKGSGYISGVNSRSVLLAVYRFLRETGVRFLYPGDGGEFIPSINISNINITLDEKPSYRYRGMDIGTACTEQNFYDIIDWMPKAGMNTLFMETKEGLLGFSTWYKHIDNPAVESEFISRYKLEQFYAEGQKRLAKRGLIYHTVGHGWTCEPFGVPILDVDLSMLTISDDSKLFPEFKKYLALTNGERTFKGAGGKSFDFNLCYGNPQVQEIMIESAIYYAKQRPNVDVIHFWFGDSINTQCECELCKDTLPSDFYIHILNEIDARLTKEKIDTKLVFLLYFDLLWPPEKEVITNPDRFIMMFAPITRSYTKPFENSDNIPAMDSYVRNKLNEPKSPEANLSYLKAWQKMFKGDSFCFDYHMIWDHYKDPGYWQTAKVLHKDIQNLADLELDGAVNCQTTRAFFPTGLLMHVQAETLWNRNATFDEIQSDYFSHTFGEDAEICKEYLSDLSEMFNPEWQRKEIPTIDEKQAVALQKIPSIIQGFMPVINKNLENAINNYQITAWNILNIHAEYCKILSKALVCVAKGDDEQKDILYNEFLIWAGKMEILPEIQPYFEYYWFWHSMWSVFNKRYEEK